MLRIALVILLLANAGYFAYGQGWLEPLGLRQATTAEPERMQQQLRPEAVQLQDARKSARREAKASPSPACLQSGPIDEGRIEAVRELVAGKLAQGRYVIDDVITPARWIVYMGRYADAEALAKKKAELRARGVTFEPTNNGNLEPGLILASAPSKGEINRKLEALSQRGVRTARVLEERPAARHFVLRIPAADDDVKAALPVLALSACAPG